MAFTIDRVIRMTAEVVGDHTYPNGATMFSDGDILFTVKDVQDASLNTSAELEDAVDGQGNVINQYLRSKTAEWSGSNALFDFGMAAAQFGDKVITGSQTVQKTEIIEVAANASSATLAGSLKANGNFKVYNIDRDGMTLGAKVSGATVSANAVAGLPVDASNAKKYFVKYDVEVANATKIENRADAAGVPFKLTVEALGNDTCTKNTSYLYITAPYAKMAPDFDWSIATESTHDFTINCMKDYCGSAGLFTVIKA